MPSDSTYQLGVLANADAYTDITLDGSGHLRVSVEPDCVTVDYVRAYLPADTVSGEHQNGELGYSYTVGTCTTNTATNFVENEDIKIFPNPADKRLVIQTLATENPLSFSFVNSVGQTVLTTQNKEIDISSLLSGFYFLSIKTATKSWIKKLVIHH
jgi:hypothetical protein